MKTDSLGLGVKGLDLEDLDTALAKLDLDHTVPPVSHRFRGGTSEAKRLLRKFLTEHLPKHEESRPHPETTHVSHMSKYSTSGR
ncbi:hypothetical protein KYC5002_33060 [Archangium violaceum]|uniref:hypothetical protein n=1 Tax=Archangium violaceum TaxID=83451 RepID=UPI002B2D5242|nr:hypothetical protein KYC5002_33060 [Archangium gephyra]